MTATEEAALIAVDWGTSRLRAMLLAADGAVVAEAESGDGIGSAGGRARTRRPSSDWLATGRRCRRSWPG